MACLLQDSGGVEAQTCVCKRDGFGFDSYSMEWNEMESSLRHMFFTISWN